jgi:hypothetical protein
MKNTESNQEGPSISLEITCSGCKYVRTERYSVQSDNGCDVSCAHESAPFDKYIGDTTWTTPSWCPLSKMALGRFAEQLSLYWPER